MNLILSDTRLDLPSDNPAFHLIDLSDKKISNCIGCFGCWTKTPGKCVIRDDAVKIYPEIAKSSRILYVSRVKYGGYDTVMKTMLERAIPIQQAFLRLVQGETHHLQRSVLPKQAVVLGYGSISEEEKEIFLQLVERNARNMCFQDYRVLFAEENRVEEAVRNEVLSWGIL